MSYRRTEYSETMQIPQTSRGFFLRNRDSMKDTHHVQLFFPRDQRSGDYQTMVIKGGPNAIAKARVRLNQILVEANAEYADYKERKYRRKQWERRMTAEPKAPSSVSPKQNKKKSVINNRFALLLDEDDNDVRPKKSIEKVTEEFPALVRDDDELTRKERRQAERRERIAKRKDTNSDTQMPMNFAEAAAKPAEEPAEEPVEIQEKPVPLPRSTMPICWGDIVDSDSEDDYGSDGEW